MTTTNGIGAFPPAQTGSRLLKTPGRKRRREAMLSLPRFRWSYQEDPCALGRTCPHRAQARRGERAEKAILQNELN
jgi:hypothetical protein